MSDPGVSPNLVANKAASTTGFLDSIGICGTSNAAAASMLSYLGINHLRTTMTTASSLLAAGQNGAKMDVILPWYMGAITTNTLKSFLAQVDQAAPVVETIEGPNEVNGDPDSFEGLKGAVGVQAEQKQIYALVKADTTLNNASKSTSVYNFTVLQGTPAGAYGDMSAYADSMNMHAYGGPGIPSSWIFPYETAQYRVAGKPLVITETGATTIATTGGVTEVMQARYDIKALLDAYSLNVSRTYLFNLQDWAPASNTSDFSAHYGLYNFDGTIKLAGTAIHNLTTVLSQTSPGAVGTGNTLSYSVSGLPYYGKTELLAKAGGVFDLALWNETTDWNATTRSGLTIPTNQITLTLASTFETIAVYDPLISANPIALVSNASSIKLNLNDDPLIVELTPTGTAARVAAFLHSQANAHASLTVLQPSTNDITISTVNANTEAVYRFFDPADGTHFFTSSDDERNSVILERPDLIYEGVGLQAIASNSEDSDALPVFRFFDTVRGTHFFTASRAERDAIVASRNDLVYEPSSTFYEHSSLHAGDAPVYRFFDQQNGTHFYTSDTTEHSNTILTRPDLIDEGISFFAPKPAST